MIRQKPEEQTLRMWLLIYHASIAAARVRGGTSISSLDDGDIAAAASGQLAERWFGEPFVALFEEVLVRLTRAD